MPGVLKKIRRRGEERRLGLRLSGMPELDAVIAAGRARLQVWIATSPDGLGSVPIELEAADEIVLRVPLVFDDAPNEAEAIVIAHGGDLPRLKILPGDPRLVALARMLAGEASK